MRQGKDITFNHAHGYRSSQSRRSSVTTSPAAQGLALAINRTMRLKEASTEHWLAMKPQGSIEVMPLACVRPPNCRTQGL
jgi:hypothetical protein